MNDMSEKAQNQQIEITPEMIEAGLLELFAYGSEYSDDAEECVAAIYVAMGAARG